MTLLVTVFAAVTVTVIWYKTAPETKMNLGMLCFMLWGASVMWFIDAVFEYAELKAEYFTPEPSEMLNDLFLGLSVIALALIIWLVALLIKDPEGKVKAAILKRKK